MTPEEKEREILERRAAELARVVEDDWHHEATSRVAVVTVGSEVTGIPADAIEEIVRAPAVAALANLPPWIRGVFHHRGELVTAVDLGAWLHGSTKASQAKHGFVVLVQDGRGLAVGLFVDSVVGFREIRESELATEFQDDSGDKSRPITAVTRDLLALLDLERLFDDPEFGRSSRKNSET